MAYVLSFERQNTSNTKRFVRSNWTWTCDVICHLRSHGCLVVVSTLLGNTNLTTLQAGSDPLFLRGFVPSLYPGRSRRARENTPGTQGADDMTLRELVLNTSRKCSESFTLDSLRTSATTMANKTYWACNKMLTAGQNNSLSKRYLVNVKFYPSAKVYNAVPNANQVSPWLHRASKNAPSLVARDIDWQLVLSGVD